MRRLKKMNQRLIFDYIVIGTGPAGAVIAKTLSDNKKNSVLVLEAGENNDRDKRIKDSTYALQLNMLFFPNYFWQGKGVPQRELDGRFFNWTTGRLFGGGSSINTMQYVRPTSSVLREWQRLLGFPWTPKEAINNFIKLEKYNGITTVPAVHGFNGALDIRQAPVKPTSMAEKLVLAIEQATGFSEILDYNDPKTPLGPFTRWQLFQQPNGQRESASTAFLSPDILTPNGGGVNGRKLNVLFKSTALKVFFREKRAAGVDFLKDGKCFRAYIRKKVIISAGINSTQLLMVSGIGPKNLLKKSGIPVIFDNPNVGQNLTNHTLSLATFTTNPKDNPLPPSDPNALYTGGAFLPDPTPDQDQNRRGVQLTGVGLNDMLIIAISLLQPRSHGIIKIQSSDPLKIVLADEGILTNHHDLESIKNIYKIQIKNIAEKLKTIDQDYQLISPTLEIINNDTMLEQFIKENIELLHHEEGSLRMAPLTEGGVVDNMGQVYGVSDLIVADNSIIPFIVDGNTTAPAYLIGLTIAQELLR